eukprot:TRINITY_DN22807_c2_g2_i1.p1 TRINITY_DN22807_c2_g2~~TRINITY_DN22807_c2_g2_i1.p1  ORF type:complete len:163 (-),score=28.22 TRINITY_DN22807_c2_g2_i1:75-563(-)
MVMFLLYIKAELENIGSLKLPEGYSYCITVKNSAGEDVREGVYVSAAEEHEMAGSRGTANFVLKWVRDARSNASLNVTEVKKVTREYTGEDSGQFVPIIGFDCRGMEPIAFHPENGWIVTSSGGKVFDDVDLRENEWADYDEENDLQVNILEFESKFEVYNK